VAEPFLSEIRLMSFNFAPKGWALCNGQLLPVNQNPALFALLSTRFGGDGNATFALPDLRGRVPIHVGNGHVLGEKGGEPEHTLTLGELPAHTHQASFPNAAPSVATPPGNLPGQGANLYGPAAAPTAMAPATVTTFGGSQAHANLQPYLGLTFCIALQGLYPAPPN
jgi:microcystin-dependent protein